jgi:hypothetical protein
MGLASLPERAAIAKLSGHPGAASRYFKLSSSKSYEEEKIIVWGRRHL